MPKLQVKPRETQGRKNYVLRNEGQVPAIIYGTGLEPMSVAVDHNTLAKLFQTAGESTLIEMQVEGGKTVNVLIQDLQKDPLRDEIIHADFRVVDMNKPIEAEVKLKFVGESAAVKALGGTLVRPLESLLVKALPKDLISVLEVDLSKLATFDDVVRVSDLAVPSGVEILEDDHRTLAVVTPPRSEEEMAALDEAIEGDVGAVEVEGEKPEGEPSSAEASEGKEGETGETEESAKKEE